MTKTNLFVHGAWLNSKSWEKWKARYEAKGGRAGLAGR